MTFSPELEAKFEKMLRSYPEGRQRSAVVPMLIYAQDEVGAITQELVEEVAKRCGVEPLKVEEVIGYYSMLHRQPLGRYHIQICTNISCMLRDAYPLWQHAQKKLGLGHKEVSPDGLFSLEEVECIGACAWAPAIQVNYDFYHEVTPEKFDAIVEKLKAGEPAGMQPKADALAQTVPAGQAEARRNATPSRS